MPFNTWSTKQWALNHTPLQEISPSPNPNDIVITTSPKPTPEPTMKALIKRTGNCPLCRLPHVYNHITWCCGLTNGYTCCCHKEMSTHEPAPSETNTVKTPISLTTVQQLDEFYPDKASYLSFQTKVPPLPLLIMHIIPTNPSSTRFRWQKNFFPPSELWMRPMLLQLKPHS